MKKQAYVAIMVCFGLSLCIGFVNCHPQSTGPSDGGTPDTPSTKQWGKADLSCTPPNNTAPMPKQATEYAKMCEQHGLGVPPKVSCEEGVRVPITVNGKEVFQTPSSCDNTSMLKPTCNVGSKIGRRQGRDAKGTPLPDVIWIYFCRATGDTKSSSVQMIAYHNKTGATCFFEANEGKDSYLREVLGRDAKNGLTGQMPGLDDPNFNRAFIPAPGQCVQCHQNNPFIRNPWLDGAKHPTKPTEPILPTLGAKSPYYVVGGGDWDMRTIHIEGNKCLSCHRVGMEIDQIFAANGFDVNQYMPPHAPGSMSKDYQQLLACWKNGPENTPGCDWIIPPAGRCQGGIVGKNYPYPSSYFNKGKTGGKNDNCYDSCIAKGASESDCKQACSGGKNDGCYDSCIAKGASETICKEACPGKNDKGKTCYDDCIKAGKSKVDCQKGCAYTPPTTCQTNADCKQDPKNPICDTKSSTCVAK